MIDKPVANIGFAIKPHSRTSDEEVVEILWNGVPCAVMYRMPRGIKIISAHMDGPVLVDQGEKGMPIPAVHINFDPQPYSIQGGKIVKHTVKK